MDNPINHVFDQWMSMEKPFQEMDRMVTIPQWKQFTKTDWRSTDQAQEVNWANL